MGACAAVLVDAWFFQSYRSWAFDRQTHGEPASIRRFLVQSASLSEPDDDAEFIGNLAAAGTRPPSFSFHPPTESSVVGRIEIPRVGVNTMVLEGVSHQTLSLAVGHIPGTALPGKLGNIGLAGHRDTFFRSLAGIHLDDVIVLTTLNESYRYRVKSTEVVSPRETSVLRDLGLPVLTLVTCYPFHYLGPAPRRFIVHAVQEM